MLTFEVEIHREKGEIVRDVDEAQAIAELDAIENRDRFRRDVDVIEVQVAMAIANALFCDALLEEPRIRDVEVVRERRITSKATVEMVFPTNACTCSKFSSVLIFNFSGVPHSSISAVGFSES